MVEIPVERKSGKGWLWALLALLLLGLLLWWLLADDDADRAAVGTGEPVAEAGLDPVGTPDGAAQPGAAGADADGAAGAGAGGEAGQGPIGLAAVAQNPQAYVGRDDFRADRVTVPSDAPITDRGFWIEEGDSRLFALVVDQPRERPVHVERGQALRLTGGRIRDASALGDLPGDALDANTRAIVEQQDAFLLVNEDNIEILSGG